MASTVLDSSPELAAAHRRTWRDPFSALSHAAGALAAVVGLIVLVVLSPPSTPKLVSFVLYGVSMVALFSASASYHFFDLGPRGNKMLRRLDHASIFMLIAGTYVPVFVHHLEGTWRLSMLGLTLGITVLGVGFKLTWFSAPRWLDAALYLAMGWMVAIPWSQLIPNLSDVQFGWLVTGGVLYSVGAVIYALKWPDPLPDRFGFHEIWHVFVLAATAALYGMVFSLLETPCPPF